VVTVGWHEVVDPNGSKHSEWDVASYAAGWHKNSARPGQVGNVVLSGHNNIEGEVFRNLEKFQIGDTITLYGGGKTFDYTVTDKFVVLDKGAPYDERVKNARWIGPFPDERLTLVSCWPPTNNTHRMFIIAKPQK
jgi:sortase A